MLHYIDAMIEARKHGEISDHVHLGIFPTEPNQRQSADSQKLNTQALATAQHRMSLHHIDRLDIQDGQTVVDIGAGFGGTLRLIDGAILDAQLHGINIDPRQIQIASETTFRNPITWHLCDAANFADHKQHWADRLLSLEALFHFQNPLGFFQAAGRALRAQGILVVSTILFTTTNSATLAAINVVCEGFAPWPYPHSSVTELISLANTAGLTLVHHEDLAPLCLPSFAWMCPPSPPKITNNPVQELRRLFEWGRAKYPLLVFKKATQPVIFA